MRGQGHRSVRIDGARYYAINGVAKSGWWNLTDADGENSYYYFDKETFKGLNGPSRAFFENVTYTFDNGKLLKGEWLTTDQGTKYYYGPTFVQGKWYTVEGEKYYFDPQGYRYTGLRYVKESYNHDDHIYWMTLAKMGFATAYISTQASSILTEIRTTPSTEWSALACI